MNKRRRNEKKFGIKRRKIKENMKRKNKKFEKISKQKF